MRIVITGGGTGGHLFPGIALAEALGRYRPRPELHFVGTRRGLEARVIPQKGWPCHYLSVRGLPRGRPLAMARAAILLPVALVEAGALLARLRPAVVVGTGGYASAPTVGVAMAAGIRTVILEQNMSPGLTTRYLASRVSQVHVSFPDTARRLGGRSQVRVSGNPVREEILKPDRQGSRRLMGLEEDRSTLLILGGSQGAHGLNRLVAEALGHLPPGLSWQAVFQTGADDHRRVAEEFAAAGLPVRVRPFIEEMGAAYGCADLVISRAGATTVAELTARGLPALLIPYPWAAGGHQEENARWMADAGAAQVLPERGTAVEDLALLVAELLTDGDRRARMAAASAGAGRPRAAEVIARAVWELACEREKT